MRHLLISFLLLCAASISLNAQKAAALKSQGEAAFADQRWEEAYNNLNQYQQQKPGDLEVISKIGQSAYFLHLPDQAKQYLEYVTDQRKSSNPLDWFYMARTYHGLMEWEKAIEAYKQFLRRAPASHPFRANVYDNIQRCVSGMSARPDETVALVENLGKAINSAGDEFAPLESVNHNDRLYFSASRPGTTGGIRNDEGYEDEKRGHWCSDMFVASRQTGGWESATSFSSLQNTSRFEVALGFTNNGQVLHFFRGFTLYGGQIFTDTSGLTDEYRSTPTPFSGPIRAEEGDETPLYFNDSVLIFASRRAGGQGGLDLWASRRDQGVWSVAVNLGTDINTPYDETSPFLSKDGKTLFFSSNRTEGIGGLDVWKASFKPESRTWTSATHLGIGVNSAGDDAGFRLTADGSAAYFSSNRLSDNFGQRDLYIAYFKEPLTEQAFNAPFAFFQEMAAVDPGTSSTPSVTLAPLFYNTDRDVLSTVNNGIIKSAAAMALQFPDIRLLVTVHTDDAGPLKFDLYSGIKRAETIAKSLNTAGVPSSRIILRSAGPGFPFARNIINGTTSTDGQMLNRRIEITPALISETLPLQFRLERPLVRDEMAAAGTTRLDEHNKGLLFRVELSVSRQVITSDALGLFSDLLIESEPGTGEYRYLSGAERTFANAVNLKKEVIAAGFPGATVVAYLNGVRLPKAEAIGLIKKHPDLANYIRS